jgi:hypothetical protein
VACQVLPLNRLGERAQALDAPVDKFRDWQEITNSIFCSRPLAGLKQQMEVWFSLRGTTAEKPTHAAKNEKEFTPALLPSASGELLLDKDLSWKSGNR